MEKFNVISKNEKRNMQQVVTVDGRTFHIAIDKNKPTKPKTNLSASLAESKQKDKKSKSSKNRPAKRKQE